MLSLKRLRPIILEGPDGGGKSTLIAQSFPNAIHLGGPPKTPAELVSRLHVIRPGLVYDRWAGVSERVYGLVLRGKPLCGIELFNRVTALYEPTIIYCRPPDSVLDENLNAQVEKEHKPQSFIDQIVKRREEIREQYDSLMHDVLPHLGCDVYHYDYTDSTE